MVNLDRSIPGQITEKVDPQAQPDEAFNLLQVFQKAFF